MYHSTRRVLTWQKARILRTHIPLFDMPPWVFLVHSILRVNEFVSLSSSGCTFILPVGSVIHFTVANNCNRLRNVRLSLHAARIRFSKCVALIHLTKAKA